MRGKQLLNIWGEVQHERLTPAKFSSLSSL